MLFDYGGTLVEEVSYDPRAGIELLLENLTHRPRALRLDEVVERAERITREVANRRDEFQIETPWPALTRLIFDYFGVHFARPLPELEIEFWDASVKTRPMPGALDALRAFADRDIPLGVVSNSSFRGEVIRFELAKHGLSELMSVIVASADYAVRKPNPLLFEVAAALLELPARDIWFVGDRLDTDIAGAKAAGMTGVWLAPPNAAMTSDPDLVVTSWNELLARAAEGGA
jgi:putative hydrolase of the HAD superfamily